MRKRTRSSSRRLPRSRHPGDRASNNQSASASWRAVPPNLWGSGWEAGTRVTWYQRSKVLRSWTSWGLAEPWLSGRAVIGWHRRVLWDVEAAGVNLGPDYKEISGGEKRRWELQGAECCIRRGGSWFVGQYSYAVHAKSSHCNCSKDIQFGGWFWLGICLCLQIFKFGCKTHTFKRRCL